MHTAIYGYPPPRIFEKIVTNMGKIEDWYINDHVSYIRFFNCSVPPHALPLFLLDQLVCCEVSHHIVHVEISKELKAIQKQVWPIFLMQIGTFSLLDYVHLKVQSMALEEIKLVDI